MAYSPLELVDMYYIAHDADTLRKLAKTEKMFKIVWLLSLKYG